MVLYRACLGEVGGAVVDRPYLGYTGWVIGVVFLVFLLSDFAFGITLHCSVKIYGCTSNLALSVSAIARGERHGG